MFKLPSLIHLNIIYGKYQLILRTEKTSMIFDLCFKFERTKYASNRPKSVFIQTKKEKKKEKNRKELHVQEVYLFNG